MSPGACGVLQHSRPWFTKTPYSPVNVKRGSMNCEHIKLALWNRFGQQSDVAMWTTSLPLLQLLYQNVNRWMLSPGSSFPLVAVTHTRKARWERSVLPCSSTEKGRKLAGSTMLRTGCSKEPLAREQLRGEPRLAPCRGMHHPPSGLRAVLKPGGVERPHPAGTKTRARAPS